MDRIVDPEYVRTAQILAEEIAEHGIAVNSISLRLPESGEVELGLSTAAKYAALLKEDENGDLASQLVVCSEKNTAAAVDGISEAVLDRLLEEAGKIGVPLDYDGEQLDLGVVEIDFSCCLQTGIAFAALPELLDRLCFQNAVIVRGIFPGTSYPLVERLLDVDEDIPIFVVVSSENYESMWIRELVIKHGLEICVLPTEEMARTPSKYRGLDEINRLCERIAAIELEKRRNPMLGDLKNHVVLFGDPGTGKTTSARLIYEALKNQNIVPGPWISASRSDLIGRFVGETAYKISSIFKQAEGGVLFVDEAGFLLGAEEGGNGGSFLREAVKEFVRFMENGSNVICIFGMYASERDAFLSLDDGLSSRIHHFVELKYSEEQLIEIFRDMVLSKGYEIDEEALSEAAAFFSLQKTRTGAGFGNAREARRLLEAAITELCLERRYSEEGTSLISLENIKKAASRLLTGEKPKKMTIGF